MGSIWVIPPRVGAFAEGPGPGWDLGWGCGGWAGQGSRTQDRSVGVGDSQGGGGAADGDGAAVMRAVVMGYDRNRSIKFRAAESPRGLGHAGPGLSP